MSANAGFLVPFLIDGGNGGYSFVGSFGRNNMMESKHNASCYDTK